MMFRQPVHAWVLFPLTYALYMVVAYSFYNQGVDTVLGGERYYGTEVDLRVWPRIAIGLAVTSKGMNASLMKHDLFSSVQFFTTLLPSFCATASAGYDYHFYLAFDKTDTFFFMHEDAFQERFRKQLKEKCAGKSVYPIIHFLRCNHSANPAWAQNEAMMDGYLDESEYYYRVNDDSLFESPGWTEVFIDVLSKRDPPNVGVVGPTHSGGNTKILTHDFVHKTHLEIFGLYYPRFFTDLWADTWITGIYQPDYFEKTPNATLTHTMRLGKRYATRNWAHYRKVGGIIEADRSEFTRYLRYRNETPVAADGKKVIAMALYGSNPRYTYGAIRNAQLLPMYFPGWTLRIYLSGHSNEAPELTTPPRILRKLRSLGAQLVLVEDDKASLSPKLWPYLVADDHSVEYFLVRHAGERLSDRDFSCVEDWVEQGPTFHCIRDHPSQTAGFAQNGMWGARSAAFRKYLPFTLTDLLKHAPPKVNMSHNYVLPNIIWPFVKENALCHDSVSCEGWSFCKPVAGLLPNTTFVGQEFNEFHKPLHDDKASKTRRRRSSAIKAAKYINSAGKAKLKLAAEAAEKAEQKTVVHTAETLKIECSSKIGDESKSKNNIISDEKSKG